MSQLVCLCLQTAPELQNANEAAVNVAPPARENEQAQQDKLGSSTEAISLDNHLPADSDPDMSLSSQFISA